VTVAGALVMVACGGDGGQSSAGTLGPPSNEATLDQSYPDVIAVTVHPDGEAFRFDVTMSSPYDTPARFADAWRVIGPDGTVLAVRELLHDHAGEQPFTRSLSGVQIPPGVESVTVEGRDKVNGWGGASVDVDIP
jgi:hypothetical protein